MRSFLFIISVLCVMGLAFWAYSENYKTQAALGEVERLQGEIGRLMETRAVLRAEWAYLNRPDRLRDLASINFERLGLVPLRPEQYGNVHQIAYPPAPLPELDEVISLAGTDAEPGALAGAVAEPLMSKVTP